MATNIYITSGLPVCKNEGQTSDEIGTSTYISAGLSATSLTSASQDVEVTAISSVSVSSAMQSLEGVNITSDASVTVEDSLVFFQEITVSVIASISTSEIVDITEPVTLTIVSSVESEDTKSTADDVIATADSSLELDEQISITENLTINVLSSAELDENTSIVENIAATSLSSIVLADRGVFIDEIAVSAPLEVEIDGQLYERGYFYINLCKNNLIGSDSWSSVILDNRVVRMSDDNGDFIWDSSKPFATTFTAGDEGESISFSVDTGNYSRLYTITWNGYIVGSHYITIEEQFKDCTASPSRLPEALVNKLNEDVVTEAASPSGDWSDYQDYLTEWRKLTKFAKIDNLMCDSQVAGKTKLADYI